MQEQITLGLYKDSNIIKSFNTDLESLLKDKFDRGLIDEDLFNKAVEELEILKARPLNPELTLTHIIDKNGHHTIRYKRRDELSNKKNQPVSVGDVAIYNGEEQKIVAIYDNGYVRLKDGSGNVRMRSIKNVEFTHPETKQKSKVSGFHTPEDFYTDGSYNIHSKIREELRKQYSNKQIDSVLKQLHDSGLSKTDISVGLQKILQEDYHNTYGQETGLPYRTSGLPTKTVFQVKMARNEKLISEKADEIKKNIKINKIEYGLSSDDVKKITKSIIKLASFGEDIFKEVELRPDLTPHENKAIIFKMMNDENVIVNGDIKVDKYGRVSGDEVILKKGYFDNPNNNIKFNKVGKLSIHPETETFDLRVNHVDNLGINSRKLKSLKNLKLESVGNVDIKIDNLEDLKGLPETINGNLLIKGSKSAILKNMPKTVKGSLAVYDGGLESLEGFPEVGLSINVSGNKLKTLEGLQDRVNGSLDVSNNDLKNFKGAPKYVKGNFIFKNMDVESLYGFPKQIGAFELFGNGSLKRDEVLEVSDVTYPDRDKILPHANFYSLFHGSSDWDKYRDDIKDKYFLKFRTEPTMM